MENKEEGASGAPISELPNRTGWTKTEWPVATLGLAQATTSRHGFRLVDPSKDNALWYHSAVQWASVSYNTILRIQQASVFQ